MKSTFTLLLVIFAITLKAQTPLCHVYHGCGGATVVAYQGDLGWSSITYDFQRLQGGNWVTIHQTIENYHLVIPGDIIVATQYRAILRNNITSEERISNGVTVDPAKFNDAVIKPKPVIPAIGDPGQPAGLLVDPNDMTKFVLPFFSNKIKWKNNLLSNRTFQPPELVLPITLNRIGNTYITVTDYCGN